MTKREFTVVEICAGAGGQALGLEKAGFRHTLAVEIDKDAVATLKHNRPKWKVLEADVREIKGPEVPKTDLFAGGVPCPPFSLAGQQLGSDDERDLFPEALRLIKETRPRAVMLENVRGLAAKRFETYRDSILDELSALGYDTEWKLVYSSWFGVPQLRPRFILIAFRDGLLDNFEWPTANEETVSVGEALYEQMAVEGWTGAKKWAEGASEVAPTIVGGSKKHGGADLGPTRARAAWLKLGVDGRGVANEPPNDLTPHDAIPRLTNRMVATVQGFPPEWEFIGRKTSIYRQIGNAFPPPVAQALGLAIRRTLEGASERSVQDFTSKTLNEGGESKVA